MLLPCYPTLLSSILGKMSLPLLVCFDEGLGPARTHYSTTRPRPKASPLPKTRVERVTGYRHCLMDWWKNLKVIGIGSDIFGNTFPVSSTACVRWVYLHNGEHCVIILLLIVHTTIIIITTTNTNDEQLYMCFSSTTDLNTQRRLSDPWKLIELYNIVTWINPWCTCVALRMYDRHSHLCIKGIVHPFRTGILSL